MKKPYWTVVGGKGPYTFWKSPDGVYQLTKGDTPPDTTAGYYSLEAILNLKGVKK